MTRLPILDRKQMNILSTTTVYVFDPGYSSAEKLLTTSASVNKPNHIHHCSNYWSNVVTLCGWAEYLLPVHFWHISNADVGCIDNDLILQTAHQNGEDEISLSTLGRVYTIDFNSMQQINEDTGTARGIQRKPNPLVSPNSGSTNLQSCV